MLTIATSGMQWAFIVMMQQHDGPWRRKPRRRVRAQIAAAWLPSAFLRKRLLQKKYGKLIFLLRCNIPSVPVFVSIIIEKEETQVSADVLYLITFKVSFLHRLFWTNFVTKSPSTSSVEHAGRLRLVEGTIFEHVLKEIDSSLTWWIGPNRLLLIGIELSNSANAIRHFPLWPRNNSR